MCSTQEPRETSLEEKGFFLDQAPGRARNPPSSVLRSWQRPALWVGAPRPQAEPRPLSKGSAQSYGDDRSTLSPEGTGVGS